MGSILHDSWKSTEDLKACRSQWIINEEDYKKESTIQSSFNKFVRPVKHSPHYILSVPSATMSSDDVDPSAVILSLLLPYLTVKSFVICHLQELFILAWDIRISIEVRIGTCLIPTYRKVAGLGSFLDLISKMYFGARGNTNVIPKLLKAVKSFFSSEPKDTIALRNIKNTFATAQCLDKVYICILMQFSLS